MDSSESHYDYESGLQYEFVSRRCLRDSDSESWMYFSSQPRHMKIEFKGMIIWSVQAVPLHDQSTPPPRRRYSFDIMDVRVRSRTSILPRGDQAACPREMSLPPKYKHLGFDTVFRSAFTFKEALDRLEWYSNLFSDALSEEPGRRNRWLMILDAEIATVSCATAREATDAAGKAAAGALSECPILPDACNSNIEEGEETGGLFERWSIDGWSVADELWASEQPEKLVLRKKILCQAAEEGNVLQWCGVEVHRGPHPSFELEIDLREFLEGDDVVLRIGIANHRPLRVRVSLTENVEVVCSQEGIERQTSLGLGYLLPDMVRDHVVGALRQTDDIEDGANVNVVEQLLQRVVGYLAFLGSSCSVCGYRRVLEVPSRSTCENICGARMQRYAAAAAAAANATEDQTFCVWMRREKFVRRKFPDTREGLGELGRLLDLTVVPVGSDAKTEKNEIGYELAVQKVARSKNCRRITSKLEVGWSSSSSADEEK